MSGTWIHTMDSRGLTPLDRAFEGNHKVVADIMMRYEKASPTTGAKGVASMHRAATMGLTEAVSSLLSFGANPNSKDDLGETPLHKAVREGHIETVKLLLDVSDANDANSEGMTPLHWACLAGDQSMVALLVQHGADPGLRNEYLDGMTPAELAKMMGYDDLEDALAGRITVF